LLPVAACLRLRICAVEVVAPSTSHGGVEPIEARRRRQRTASTTRHGRTIKGFTSSSGYLHVDGERLATENPSNPEKTPSSRSGNCRGGSTLRRILPTDKVDAATDDGGSPAKTTEQDAAAESSTDSESGGAAAFAVAATPARKSRTEESPVEQYLRIAMSNQTTGPVLQFLRSALKVRR
jgi:hypothetical protein